MFPVSSLKHTMMMTRLLSALIVIMGEFVALVEKSIMMAFDSFCGVSDDSAFSGVQRLFRIGFRLYNQIALFVYSQLQSVLQDKYLGDISDWDQYLTIDLRRTDLPFKTPNENVLKTDFHRLVLSNKLRRPGNTFCGILLKYKVVTSDLLRGLSCFDSADSLEAKQEKYISGVERLTTHFVQNGWNSSSDKTTNRKPVSISRGQILMLRGDSDGRLAPLFIHTI